MLHGDTWGRKHMTSTVLKTLLETTYPVQQIVAHPCMPPNVRYRRHQPWTNWGGTAQCTPEFTFYPRYVEDLIQIVHFARATERKIRVAGTGHSWSALVPTDDILVCIHLCWLLKTSVQEKSS